MIKYPVNNLGNGISVIIPADVDRLFLLKDTLVDYLGWGIPANVEFLIVSRSIVSSDLNFLRNFDDTINFRVIPYSWSADTFSQSMALNIGIRESKYNSVVVVSPETAPKTNVLYELMKLLSKNVICQVFDLNEDGSTKMSLVNTKYRSETPSMHFLAMFNKSDLLKINGWDEDFMQGQAYDDDDFGQRFSRAGIQWEMHDEIQGNHKYHPRNPNPELWEKDRVRYEYNKNNGIIRVKNGVVKE